METKVNRKSWLVFGIAAVFYLYELALRVSPSVMTHDLMTTFNATATVLGLLVSFYYYAYTILQLPCGLILDKMGPRRLLGCSALLCVIGSAMFAGFNEISVAQVGRFLVGAGSACAFISCLQIAAKLFPTKYFVILAGVTNMMGTLGGLFGGPPVARAVNAIGWRTTTFWLAGIGIVIAILVFVVVPKKLEAQPMKTSATFGGLLRELPSLLKNSQIVLSGIVASFMYLPVDAFAELWAVPFFMSKYGIGNEQASMASAVVFIGVAIGSVLLAVVARKIGSYMKTIRLSSLFTAVLFLPLIFSDCSIYIAFVFVFLIGFLTGAQPIGFVVAKNNASAEVSGTTLALTNCIVMLIGSIFQPFLGALLDFFWSGTTDAAGLRFYDVTCYQKAILIIPVFLVISYFVSMFIRETINCERE
ncbi:MAG: MFS transporter [Alphaproteobacteria bacterium]|nr:MFS transporter [Alphaproteobacteria bacterium]